MKFHTYRVVNLLSSMSRLQRRVAMLLAAIHEAGPQCKLDMEERFPSGLLGELSCAHRHDYIQQLRDGRYAITPKGKEILSWICGERPHPPLHWSNVVRKAAIRKQ